MLHIASTQLNQRFAQLERLRVLPLACFAPRVAVEVLMARCATVSLLGDFTGVAGLWGFRLFDLPATLQAVSLSCIAFPI
jgi:hypothetical protein